MGILLTIPGSALFFHIGGGGGVQNPLYRNDNPWDKATNFTYE